MKNKQESMQTFKQEFEKLRVGGLSEQEQNLLRKLFFKLTKEEQKKVLQEYKDLKKEPEKSFFEGLKKQLGELKKDVEKQNRLKGGFDELRNDFEKNEGLKQIFDLFNAYVDIRLDKSFSLAQKDQIKLALFGVVEKKLNPAGLVEVTIQKYIKPLQDLVARFNGKEENEAEVKKEDFEKLSKSFNETFEKLGISGLASFVDEKIDKINKKKNTSFDSVINIIDPKNKGKITKETVKKDTEKLAKQLESGKKSGEQLKKSIKKLPMGIGETIMGFLRDIAKEYPILGFIFSLFFGADFLSEANDTQEKSLQNLSKFKKQKPEVLKNIDEKELQKLDPKKLEKFYKYLDSKDIDYSKDSFWKELLTGETKNEKIKKIYELLKNKDGKILEKTEKLEDLVKKLNSLEELESKKNKEKLEQESQALNTQIAQESQELDKINDKKIKIIKNKKIAEKKVIEAEKALKDAEKSNNQEAKEKAIKEKEKAKKEAKKIAEEKEKLEKEEKIRKAKLEKAKKEKEKLQQEKTFIESVNNISKLPAEIIYKGEKLKLDIENNQIVLGKDMYKIKILAKQLGGADVFKNINFNGNNINIITSKGGDCFLGLCEGKNEISKTDLIGVIKELIDNKNYKKDFFDKKTKELKANLIIEKA